MKRLTIVILLSYIVPNAFGQIYIQPSVGYTFSSHPIEVQSTMIINNQMTVQKFDIKLAEGMHLAMDLGYNFLDNFFVELNTKSTIYSKFKTSNERPDPRLLNNFSFSGYFGEINSESSIFQMTPLIGYQVHRNKFSTYFKIGPNFMKSTISRTQKYTNWRLSDDFELYPENRVEEIEYRGKFHMGLQANLGMSYSIKQNLQLVLDFLTVYNNYEITKGEIKYYEVDGVSQLHELENTNIEINEDNNKLNLSHYGINIGIRYIFKNE